MRRLVLGTLMMVGALACRRTTPATGIVVEFVSEYAIPTEINRLDVEVSSLTSGVKTPRQFALDSSSGVQLPARMLLEPSGSGGGDVRIVARGVLEAGGKETVVVTRSALVGFVGGRVLHLVLPLRRICAGRTCPGTMTCQDQGACANDERRELPDHKPAVSPSDAGAPAPSDGAATGDIGSAGDTVASDAPTSDLPAADATTAGAEVGADSAGLPNTCPAPAECNDFETSTTMEPGGRWQLGTEADMPGQIEITVDPTVGFRSKRSVRIRVLREDAGAFMYRGPPTEAGYAEYWGRVMVLTGDDRTALPLTQWRMVHSNGPVPSQPPADQTPQYTVSVEGPTLLAETDSPLATCELKGGELPTRRWTCVEWHFKGVQPDMNIIEAWIDGNPMPAVRVVNRGGTCEEGPNTLWEAPRFDNVLVGYIGGAAQTAQTHDFWFDDVAVSPAGRIGCAP